jgi:nucleotidyltransferase/DNA polymerase involved in DNA repair
MQATTLNPVMSWPVASELAAPMTACVLVTPYGVPAAERLELADALHARCARLTDHVVWLGQRGQTWPDGALLDLGRRSVSEAQADCEQLMAWLVAQQLLARIGIGSSQTLAQLAALRAASGVVRAVDPEEAQAFIQRFPVDALSGLASEAITPGLVARLRAAGLRTLGQVALLEAHDPAALHRQFGAEAGACLALIARGNDPCLPQATPAPSACFCAAQAT